MSEVSQKESSDRLLRLAAFLQQLPRARFFFNSWVGPTWEGAQSLSCGTTACAVGWASTLPEFRRLGLRLKRVPNATYAGMPININLDEYTNRDPFEAAAFTFGVTRDEAIYLFAPGVEGDLGLKNSPGHKATPKQVASHIRRFVAWRKMENAAAIP